MSKLWRCKKKHVIRVYNVQCGFKTSFRNTGNISRSFTIRKGVFRTKYMKKIVKLIKCVIKPVSHGNIFCIALQFSLWFQNLVSQNNNDGYDCNYNDNNDDSDSGHGDCDDSVGTKNYFSVERQPLIYFRSPGTNLCGPKGEGRFIHVSVMQKAIHFWRSDIDNI